MTRTDAGTRDVCPICGTTLTTRKGSLYCQSCDLFYEGPEGKEPEPG
jgi:hypothetical protein